MWLCGMTRYGNTWKRNAMTCHGSFERHPNGTGWIHLFFPVSINSIMHYSGKNPYCNDRMSDLRTWMMVLSSAVFSKESLFYTPIYLPYTKRKVNTKGTNDENK